VAIPLALLLAAFWLYLAYTAYTAGDATRAVVYLVIGAALTAWRLGAFRKKSSS
jgi:hypothetical protein